MRSNSVVVTYGLIQAEHTLFFGRNVLNWRIVWLVAAALLASSWFPIHAGSFSTDFDGTGSGSSFSISNFSSSSSSHGPSSSGSSGGGHHHSHPDESYIRQIYEEQLAEAKKRAEEEQLKRQIEQKRRQNAVIELQRLVERLHELEGDEPSVIQRMQHTQQVIEMEKRFAEARKDYMNTLPTYRNRLAWSLDHIVVPAPWHPRHYRQILLWGTLDTPQEAAAAAQDGLEDPFTGHKFDDVFAFGSPGWTDLFRVSLDYLLGQFDRLSPQTNSHLSDLKGATADELVCHSNGCRVAEVLISTGMLKVKRLRMLGGDNALFELPELKKLQQQKQLQEVSVYMTKGDIIPALGLGWEIIERIGKLGHPLKAFENLHDDLTYQALGLTDRPKFDPGSSFQVHIMSYPTPWSLHDPFQKHRYDNYSRIIKGWRLTECFNKDGTLNQRCIVY